MTARVEKIGDATLWSGDCRDAMRQMAAEGVLFDACVTDPPYHLTNNTGTRSPYPGQYTPIGNPKSPRGGFMGKTWDGGDVAFQPETWRLVFDVLKPGAHLLAFGGTRGYHRLAVAIEDAGFEVRDAIMWHYGCLDDMTQAVTPDGVKPHHKIKTGDLVLCYNAETLEYSYQPVLDVVEYDYSDTAFRLVGDFGEQVVSWNHRCIVERGGREIFAIAETLEREVYIPVLENLPELHEALSRSNQGASGPKQDLRGEVCRQSDRNCEQRSIGPSNAARNGESNMHNLRQGVLPEREAHIAGDGTDVLVQVQRRSSLSGLEGSREQGARELEAVQRSCACDPHDRRVEPGMEGWPNLPKQEGRLRGAVDQVCQMPDDALYYGEAGRLCDGASASSCASHGARAVQDGNGASQEPRRDGQRDHKPDAVRDERSAQGIRAWRGHRSSLVRVVPFHYVGKVWCLRVPTGAFVAVRGGVAFPTGNSGFPKSMDVSKQLDKIAGAEREVVGINEEFFAKKQKSSKSVGEGWSRPWMDDPAAVRAKAEITAPATDAAKQWAGWGTALKPATEIICVARKPLSERTVAANVLRHGTGALNIDASRIGTAGRPLRGNHSARPDDTATSYDMGSGFALGETDIGRWPANVILDDSEEVAAAFAAFGEKKSPAPYIRHGGSASKSDEIYGKYDNRDGGINASFGDTGTAARFFKTCGYSEEEWNAYTSVNDAAQTLCLQSEHAASALKNAAEQSTERLAVRFSDYQAPSMSVTQTELRQISEAVTVTIQNIVSAYSLGSLPKRLSLSTSHAKCVAIQSLTGIMQITTSLLRSSGFADPVTFNITPLNSERGESGFAAKRFHYTAKADSDDRAGSQHPTIKPLDLMRYLVRLITPPGGTVLDPFAGSGTTLQAAWELGMRPTGCEAEPEYQADIRRRMEACQVQPDIFLHGNQQADGRAPTPVAPVQESLL